MLNKLHAIFGTKTLKLHEQNEKVIVIVKRNFLVLTYLAIFSTHHEKCLGNSVKCIELSRFLISHLQHYFQLLNDHYPAIFY